ncbi:MAG TPA: tail fiber domain-containing protein [Cyclobacteriaceae bacterium]|nr:tail fiber domain-containing protein [Cyclobacteriaceae bacterium]
MKLRACVLACLLITSAIAAQAQNSVGIGIANPNKNAVLELISPNNNQGVLIPKLTTAQRTAAAFTGSLTVKENGLMVFDSNENKFYYWEATAWKALGTGSELAGGNGISIVNNTVSTIPQDLQLTGSTLTITNNPSATPINLSGYSQDIQLSGSTLTVTNNPAAVPINLSDLNIPQDLKLTGSTLTITNNASATPVNLSAFTGTNTDDQTLSFNGGTGVLSITRLTGGPQTVTIPTTTPPSGTAGGDLTGSYPNPNVANNAITSAKIADGTIVSADITDGTIVSADITDGTVASVDITDGTIVSADIADGTVASVDITDATIVSADIADGAVASIDITDATIVSADIADGTVASIDITDATIVSADIADGTVASIDIADNTITTLDINDGTIASVDIADNTITTLDINDGTIGSIDIAALAITNAHVATNIAVAKLAGGALNDVLTTTAGGTAWAPAPAASGTAGGDLTGTFPNPQIAALTIADGDISSTANINVNKLSIGTPSQVLITSGGIAQWANPGGTLLINAAGTQNLFAGTNVGAPSGGQDNAFYGFQAGNNATSGSWNVVIGSGAGRNNPAGNLNTLIGWVAGGANALPTFNGNTFIGAQAGQNTTSGPSTFIGEKAGLNNSSGTQSVFVGNEAGKTNTIGGQHTVVGYLADVSLPGLQNATAIGFSTIVDASNKVRIGNAAVTVIQGQVAFTNVSDRRMKTNIQPIENGLDLIMKMKPMSYNMKSSSDQRTNWGFIAQDIEALVGTNNAVVTVSADKDRSLGLRYTDFVAPLVKAVQEQQDEISDLNNKLTESEKKMDLLMAEIEKLKKAVGLKAENK